MNIFYLSADPREAAEMHVDKHVVKMIVESCQLLSTAHRVLDGVKVDKTWKLEDGRDGALYKATHINHPSAIWVRQSRANYDWLAQLTQELCKEYTHRYEKIHKCERDGLVESLLHNHPSSIPSEPSFTEPTPAMPDQYKVSGNSVESYRNYYLGEKQHIFSWKKRNPPAWLV